MPGGGSPGAGFRYSGVDPETAQSIFEALFGGGGGGGGGGMAGLFGGMAGGDGGMGGGGGPRRRVHAFSSGPRGAASMFGPPRSGGAGGRPGTPPSPGVAFGMDESDEENPFGGAFGGGGGGGGFGSWTNPAGRASPAPPAAQQVVLRLTLEDLYKGTTKVGGRAAAGESVGSLRGLEPARTKTSALDVIFCSLFFALPPIPQCHPPQKLKVTRHVYDAASGQSVPVAEVVELGVKPGWKKGTKITFPGKGDEKPGQPPADLQFVVEEAPHARFTRDGNDLHVTGEAARTSECRPSRCRTPLLRLCLLSPTAIINNQPPQTTRKKTPPTVQIPAITALCGGTASVDTLDGRRLTVPLPVPFTSRATKVVGGEGMPISKEPGKKGNLVVAFDVAFPKGLGEDQKAKLREILPAA
jgi:DnaJ family protein B protein 4